jgi:cytochrome c553
MIAEEMWPSISTRDTVKMLAFVALAVLTWSGLRGADSARAAEAANLLSYCSSCHGPDGRSPSSLFPSLAGQQKNYIVAQLRNFRDGTRTAPHGQTFLDYLVMWGVVSRLDPPTVDAIAAFYATQTPLPGEPAGSPEIVTSGRKIYTEGIPSKSVPACISCHGVRAEGNGPIPRLAGQYQAYLARQLQAFASWARQSVTMHANSENLTSQQISEVTAYLATL